MAGNTFGKTFKVTTFGESHGSACGGVIDGCPSGLHIDIERLKTALRRRKGVKAIHSTSRLEPDEPEFLSGIFNGVTTGAPIAFIVRNKNHSSDDYEVIKDRYRPGHGDYTWHKKYDHFDYTGGGRYSARETVARVAAGAIASQLIATDGIIISAWVSRIGSTAIDGYGPYASSDIENSPLRCPVPAVSEKMVKEIAKTSASGDSLGGIISARIDGVSPGLGEPIFDKIEALLAHSMMSIPAVKAFEIGDGFRASEKKGSENNDLLEVGKGQKIYSSTNRAGGTLGGITSGNPILFRVGFKPVPSIATPQSSVTYSGEPCTVDLRKGRHDVCFVPRAVAVVEAMAAITIADLWLRNRSSKL